MAEELGQISFYLAKENSTFDSVIKVGKLKTDKAKIEVRDFEISDSKVRFYYLRSDFKKSNPKWLNFINDQIDDPKKKIAFVNESSQPNGILLIEVKKRILAATFGMSGPSLLLKSEFVADFGIRTAMNMCGNEEIRQTKTSTSSYKTKQTDRQLSMPSDSSDFGIDEAEMLKFISAHIKDNKNITLQGKNNLTIKAIGEEKFNWDKLIKYCKQFLNEYKKPDYKENFPNYLNFQEVSSEIKDKLDNILIKKLNAKNFANIHLAVPEFVSDDEYSFSYSCNKKKDDVIHSYLDITELEKTGAFKEEKIKRLKSRSIYPYCHSQDKILDYKSWTVYECLVAEEKFDGKYYVLSEGSWKEVEKDFYLAIDAFIKNTLQIEPQPVEYHNIDILCIQDGKNRESEFNKKVCANEPKFIHFDQAKLRISTSNKNKEFCDILELKNGLVNIIQVKQYSGGSSINYLFSQARFYCESFMRDHVFLSHIREHVNNSQNAHKKEFLSHIKNELKDVHGKDYKVSLWFLYDKNHPIPNKDDLPLMAKYDLKMTYELLSNVYKYKDITISFIPVKRTKVSRVISKKAA